MQFVKKKFRYIVLLNFLQQIINVVSYDHATLCCYCYLSKTLKNVRMFACVCVCVKHKLNFLVLHHSLVRMKHAI